MENEFGRTYNKTGIAAGTLFTLMMISFFVFVFYDAAPSQGHATAGEPAGHTQVEADAANQADDAPAEHVQEEDTDLSVEKH
ncbi:MAG: hypothetical protein MI863_09565 [Desulfobacterales bacterium]|nr:hypothetical protein [Desulfobacterales bacterium]